MADRVGEQLGNYRLLKLIGHGGFADVYLGEHVRLGNQAAIKVLHTRLESEDIESFQQEARTIGRLAHPNIVRVIDFAVQDGTPFLVMDYAPNGTLRQRYAKGQRAPLEAIVGYTKQVADALQYAHEQKLIHRDIKPENMLIGRLDDILLSDFGIALVSQSSRYQTSNEMVGTVGYMAPEQIQGHPRPASDQYSLGIVVYEWLCGGRPFNGSVTEVATQQLVLAPPPLRAKAPTLSAALEEVVMTALAKDPNQRFGSVRAFAAALENAAQAEPSIYSLSTQLSTPVIPSPPPGSPFDPNSTVQASEPSGGSGSGGALPAASQGSGSVSSAPTVASSTPGLEGIWSEAETVRSSQPMISQPPGSYPGAGSQPYGSAYPPGPGAQGFGGAPAAPAGVYGSQPWAYGPPPGAQAAPLPPPPPTAPPVGYAPPVAPVVSAPPPTTRRFPVLWIVIALVVLLGGGGGVAAFVALTTPHPVIHVTSDYTGSALGGPPDTLLHIKGQDFSGNSTITFLLDGSPAPGAELVQSDGSGAFSADLKITDDWTFDAHTLTARDSNNHVTQQGVSITVVPQPVLAIQSRYQDGAVPAGSASTSFMITGKRFAPNSTATFLLDGQPSPSIPPAPTDARGRVQVALTVTSDWTIGTHTLTAEDGQGHTTQSGQTLEIVHQGEAGTPGPNGAPSDNASFIIVVSVQARDVGTGKQRTFSITLNVSNGRVCDDQLDTGQPQTVTQPLSNGRSYKQTLILTCSGTYKAGHLTYTETDTQDTFQLSDGGYCVAATPRVEELLNGDFSSNNSISGSFKSDATRITCPRINTFYLIGANAETGTWSGAAG